METIPLGRSLAKQPFNPIRSPRYFKLGSGAGGLSMASSSLFLALMALLPTCSSNAAEYNMTIGRDAQPYSMLANVSPSLQYNLPYMIKDYPDKDRRLGNEQLGNEPKEREMLGNEPQHQGSLWKQKVEINLHFTRGSESPS